MDNKSLAKSKRAHSLHLSKKNRHLHPSKVGSAGPSSSSTDEKKQSGKQGNEKSAQSRSSRELPSNWDRYVDEGDKEYELDSGNVVPRESTSEAGLDVVAPKSKGADYAYLISEAKDQSRYSSQSAPLFDDVLHDFYQGFGPLLSTRGQSIASWIVDDNFGQEDKSPLPNEATFLSLNLHTLAEQLAKATLSDRLFIDPDSPLPELIMEELQKLSENKHEEAPVSISAAKMPSKLEAEAELDMLLGSFTTDEPLESEKVEKSLPRDKKLEDGVDDLLKETSFLTINKSKGSWADEVKADFRNASSSANAVTKSSKLSDDFDSWFDTI